MRTCSKRSDWVDACHTARFAGHKGKRMKSPETPADVFLSKQRMLVISPHADDESFGCAGTMARIKDLGGEVYVICCSVGDLKHYDGTDDKVTAERREAEFKAVMDYLQVDDWEILFREADLHLRLDTLPRRELIALFERDCRLALDKLQPTMLAIPSGKWTSCASCTTARSSACWLRT